MNHLGLTAFQPSRLTSQTPISFPRQVHLMPLLEPILRSTTQFYSSAYLSGPQGSWWWLLSQCPEIYQKEVPYLKGQRGALGETGHC